MSPQKKKKYKNEEVAKAKVILISFPKCGRTWVRSLIGKAICEKFNYSDKLALKTFKITKDAGLLPTEVTHDYSSIQNGLKYNKQPTKKNAYKDKKVIFLIRNIKDVLVSCYFQATKRVNKFDGNISEFIRDERYGAKKIITFFNIWYNNRTVPKEFLLIRYEDLYKDPKEALIKSLKLIGLEDFEDEILNKAINFSSFNSMKQKERENYFKEKRMRAMDDDDDDSFKVRKGKIKGYNEYLNDKDIAYIDQVINEMGDPFETEKYG